MPERSTESNSDFEQVAPRTRNVPNRVRAVEAAAAAGPADAHKGSGKGCGAAKPSGGHSGPSSNCS